MTDRYEFRVDRAQRRAWQWAARKERRTLADWIRLALDDAAARSAKKQEPTNTKAA